MFTRGGRNTPGAFRELALLPHVFDTFTPIFILLGTLPLHCKKSESECRRVF